MKGITVSAAGGPAVVEERSRPALRDTYILVKVAAVALNPADSLSLQYGLSQPGYLLGCDYAGMVEDVGAGVTRFKKGDRVCGVTRPGNAKQPDDGTFAEYIVVKGDIQLHIPDSMTFENAATLGVTSITTGRAFYEKLNIPKPPALVGPGSQIFVSGGSSAMGTMVIQFAKLSGFEVLTTCSLHNFELVKSFGADHVFDRNDPKSPDALKAQFRGDITFAMDCVSNEESAAFCAKVLAPNATYSSITLQTCPREDVHTVTTLGYSFLGEGWQIMHIEEEPRPQDFERAVEFAKTIDKLLNQGQIVTHPTDIREGGLEAVIPGIKELQEGKISGKKIVVPLN